MLSHTTRVSDPCPLHMCPFQDNLSELFQDDQTLDFLRNINIGPDAESTSVSPRRTRQYPGALPMIGSNASIGSIVRSDLSQDPENHAHELKTMAVRWMSSCETWRMELFEAEDIEKEFVKALQNVRELSAASSSFKTTKVRNSTEDAITKMRRALEAESAEYQTKKMHLHEDLDARLPGLMEAGRGVWNSLMVYRGCHGSMPPWFGDGKLNVDKVGWIATGGGTFFNKMAIKFHEESDNEEELDTKPKSRAAKKRAIRCLT